MLKYIQLNNDFFLIYANFHFVQLFDEESGNWNVATWGLEIPTSGHCAAVLRLACIIPNVAGGKWQVGLWTLQPLSTELLS